jgi:hypothetical protein
MMYDMMSGMGLIGILKCVVLNAATKTILTSKLLYQFV